MVRRIALMLLAAIALHLGLPHLHASAADVHRAIRPIAPELSVDAHPGSVACPICIELSRSSASLPGPATTTSPRVAHDDASIVVAAPAAPARPTCSPERSRAPPALLPDLAPLG